MKFRNGWSSADTRGVTEMGTTNSDNKINLKQSRLLPRKFPEFQTSKSVEILNTTTGSIPYCGNILICSS